MCATILIFPKTEEEAIERSIEEESAELKAALNELDQPAPKLTAEEPAAAAARPEEMERSGECDRMLTETEMDRREREFMLEQCYTDAERAYLEESLANLSECHCEVCEAGGNCCGGPFGWTIGELLAAAYNEDIPATSVSPKNRCLILKAATELAARLTALSLEFSGATPGRVRKVLQKAGEAESWYAGDVRRHREGRTPCPEASLGRRLRT